jgi:hypothetical protein
VEANSLVNLLVGMSRSISVVEKSTIMPKALPPRREQILLPLVNRGEANGFRELSSIQEPCIRLYTFLKEIKFQQLNWQRPLIPLIQPCANAQI